MLADVPTFRLGPRPQEFQTPKTAKTSGPAAEKIEMQAPLQTICGVVIFVRIRFEYLQQAEAPKP